MDIGLYYILFQIWTNNNNKNHMCVYKNPIPLVKNKLQYNNIHFKQKFIKEL